MTTTTGPHVLESVKQAIGEQYLGGAELATVATAAALDVATVTRTLTEMGITLRTDDRPPLEPAKVLAAYAAGASIRAIARDTSRGYTTIHRILSEGGAVMRPRGSRTSKRTGR